MASNIDSALKASINMDCCIFEVTVEGVMFYPGHLQLNPASFQRITITRNSKNMYHTKAYWVKLADSNVKLSNLLVPCVQNSDGELLRVSQAS